MARERRRTPGGEHGLWGAAAAPLAQQQGTRPGSAGSPNGFQTPGRRQAGERPRTTGRIPLRTLHRNGVKSERAHGPRGSQQPLYGPERLSQNGGKLCSPYSGSPISEVAQNGLGLRPLGAASSLLCRRSAEGCRGSGPGSSECFKTYVRHN